AGRPVPRTPRPPGPGPTREEPHVGNTALRTVRRSPAAAAHGGVPRAAPEPGRVGPSVDLAFSGVIWYWRGPAPFYFVWVPPDECEAIRAVSRFVTYGWGMIPVTARIGDTEWETSLFPKDGRYLVPVKAR